jgi:BTB/POZ domain
MCNADVILQSIDHVNFRVHKSALATSSPLFGDMFTLPQPQTDETVDGLPVVHLPEDAEVLNSLISMLYPVSPEIPDTDDHILGLLAATQKYDMVAVQSLIRSEVSRKGSLKPRGAKTFRMYALACRKRLLPEMETAAHLTLDYPMTFKYLGDTTRLFDGWALRALADFRQRCSDRLNSCIKTILDPRKGSSKIWVGCPVPAPLLANDPPAWLQNLLWKFGPLGAPSTQTLSPCKFRKEYLGALQAHVKEKDCHFCMKVHTLHGEAFCEEIKEGMTQARNIQYTFFTPWAPT